MKTRTVREILAAAVLTLIIGAPAALVTLRAQAPASKGAGMPDLIGALKSTPGVLGVDAAQRTLNGRSVIFAWFENKKAVLDWYYSDMHQALVVQFSGGRQRSAEPLAGIPDDGRAILAIASMTFPAPPGPGTDLKSSVTQMAIEFYAPLPGGIAAGGRFAPSTTRVPGLVEVAISGRPAVDAR